MGVLELIPELDEALASVPHAFGGAIALAYCTGQPRGTIDVDLNIFVSTDRADEILGLLRPVVRATPAQTSALSKDGQARLRTSSTPVDVFLSYSDLHAVAERRVRRVEFQGRSIPVLDCTDLAVFKAMFDRTKDWADIIEALRAGTINLRRLRSWITRLTAADDPRHVRLDAAISEAGR
ncbi:MAG: hypothetical protein ACLGH3_10530 [Actinomycetota bacterium]